MSDDLVLNRYAQKALRNLMQVFFDFERQPSRTWFVKKIDKNSLTAEDYCIFLKNLHSQVIEGSRWISRCASSFDSEFAEVRSLIIKHAKDEHRDYMMLESDYINCGGKSEELLFCMRNIGSDALHGFIMYRASRSNPYDLLGAMWIIEGLGQKMASDWADQIESLLDMQIPVTRFLKYHGENDAEHLKKFYEMLNILCVSDSRAERIQQTAEVVARLYALQIEEMCP